MKLILFKETIQKRSLFLALALTCMAFVPKSYAEESNLKINLVNLDKPGVVFISIC